MIQEIKNCLNTVDTDKKLKENIGRRKMLSNSIQLLFVAIGLKNGTAEIEKTNDKTNTVREYGAGTYGG